MNMEADPGTVTITTYPATITFKPVQEAIDESTKIPDAIKKLAKEIVRDNLDAINEIIKGGTSKIEEIVSELKDLEVPELLAEHWPDIVDMLIRIAQALGIL
jgi:predicted translin family RNA/ssDNA-binding protein